MKKCLMSLRLWHLRLEKQKGLIFLALSAFSFAGCIIFGEFLAPHSNALLLFPAKAVKCFGFSFLVFGMLLILFGNNSCPRDSLTGLINGRIFMETEMKRRRSLLATESRFVIFFIDIDGLKKINDIHGHRAGDEAILAVVACIKKILRKNDIVIRYGGDEFVVATTFSKDSLDYDPCAFEFRIRESVRTHQLFFEDVRIPLSVSIGREVFEPRMDIDKAIKLADEKMYEEKKRKAA